MPDYFEHDVQKVATPPRVHDATQPDPEAATGTMPNPGVLVAVVGDPVDGGSPVYVESLGYCIWLTATVTDDLMVESGDLITEGGVPLVE